MSQLVSRRHAAVVGVFLLVGLSAGVTSVLANGGLRGLRGRGDVPVPRAAVSLAKHGRSVIVGRSVKNDVSRPLRLMPRKPFRGGPEREASPNPRPVPRHRDAPDAARQIKSFAPNIPSPALNFGGLGFPGVLCNCAPPDTDGEVGATQYVQIVNTGFQVFDKDTGLSVLGPLDINSVWTGFGGVCEDPSFGDPVVLYDQLAQRWLISQFAGLSAATDECIAISRSSDATGAWNRYDFTLGSDFFDYPKIGVWPDAYYMSMNVFNASGDAYLGPQPFAFDRAAMLAGDPATFVTTRSSTVFNPMNDGFLPADLDGSILPPAGAPALFLMSGTASTWKLWRFHADFMNPADSTFTLGGNLAPAGYTVLCPFTRACVPQAGVTSGNYLDAVADRPMFRLAYRNFGDHEALVGNQTVSSSGVAGIRWFELSHATSGAPAFAQQSTYQPDATWRWMGSAAMDKDADLALGFNASDATINPQIRYAGRLGTDPPNTLAQGETHLFDGTGSQIATNNRWGDYSAMTVDPVDDCTFWYTQEYYGSTGPFNWRTRIGAFKFPTCGFSSGAHLAIHGAAQATARRPGSHIDFDVTLTNSGPDPATGIVVTDDLPGGSGVNWSVDGGASNAGWSIVGSPPNQKLVGPTTLNGMAASHAHVTSQTTTSSCGSYTNAASFTSSNGGSGSASASTAVDCTTPSGPTVSVAKTGTGSGTVTSNPAGISCGAACTRVFGNGTPMTLTATPAVGSDFMGWSGAGCAGTAVCTFVLNGATTITATFTLQTRHLTVGKKGNGRGTVTSSPGGIGCGSTCSAGFPYGTALTLTAKPTATSVFRGWSGACSGKSKCALSMTVDKAATATFRAKCVVPKVLRLTLKKARARIKRAHCTVGKITRKRTVKSKRGKVLAQKPKPGKRLAPAAKVNLTVGRS